ncbi:hypothetical protein [Flavobacterium sp.]|uniref:hypothetical protein n=1 Tax=Flavobacterium sp. TaxID=239 RepID=UPI00262D2B7A|nr:hypothetical protein [Flavobacterium sp.]
MLIIETDEKNYNLVEAELINSEIDYEVVRNDGIDADLIVQIVLGISSTVTAGAVKVLLEKIIADAGATVKIGGMEFKGHSPENIIKILSHLECSKEKK